MFVTVHPVEGEEDVMTEMIRPLLSRGRVCVPGPRGEQRRSR